MTERMARPTTSYGGYIGEPKPASAGDELSPKKTLLVLVVVVGCFAVLWPKLFYPMLVANANNQLKPNAFDKGCCDVIDLKDVDAIRIMSELCKDIITQQGSPPGSSDPKTMIEHCRKAVLETCGIDISAALQERVSLGHSVRQILEEIRSLNGSLCLKYNFGVSLGRLGVPHIRVVLNPTNNIRQERPSHLRPEMLHPAFRERGKAIPHPEMSAAKKPVTQPPPRIVEGRPGPIPGMRPGLGGAGHVAQNKQQNNGMMGLLMPIYTIGFVVFFTYTLMKLAFKKKPELYGDEYLYPQVDPDEEFRQEVFESSKYYTQQQKKNAKNKNDSKIVVNAVAALLEEVEQEMHTRNSTTHDVSKETLNEQDEVRPNGSAIKEELNHDQRATLPENEDEEYEDDQPRVAVMGMETTVSSEGGKKWSRPDSPTLPHPHPEKIKQPIPPPQEIYLEGTLPADSQILVADSATKTERAEEDDSAVVLAGKMTLSVISLDSENETNKSSDEERKSSSGNTSEDFEKIDPNLLIDQINDAVQEAHSIIRDENDEEVNEKREELILNDIANEKSDEAKTQDVLAEIKQQLQIEDELLEALTGADTKSEALPLSDMIKEFLTAEENTISQENESAVTEKESKVQFHEFHEESGPESNLNDNLELATPEDVKEEVTNLAEQIIDAIEQELENVNYAEIENDLKSERADQEQTEESNSDESPRKSEERFIPQQDTLEDKADRRKKRQERLRRDLEALTSSVEEAMGTRAENDNLEGVPPDEVNKTEAELSTEDLELIQKYQSEETNHKNEQDQGSEKSFDSSDTVKERSPPKENEYLFGSREQKSLLDALEFSTSAMEGVGGLSMDASLPDDTAKVVKEDCHQQDPADIDYKREEKEVVADNKVNHSQESVKKQTEDIEYGSDEDELEDDQEDIEYEDQEIDDESEGSEPSDLEDEIRRISSREERLNGDSSENRGDIPNGSETNAENEISDEDENEEEDEDDEEIEEIIEYVDNTDEEGEEIVEIENDEIRNGHH